VPTVSGKTLIHYSSEEALLEAARRPWCRLAEAAASLACSITRGCRGAGITGSLLLEAQHAASDIDIVIHSYTAATSLLLEDPPGTPLQGSEVAAWAEREARSRGLPASLVERLYRPWARMHYEGYTASISIQVPGEPWRRTITYTGGRGRCIARVEPMQRSVASYPSIVEEYEGCDGYNAIIVLDGLYKPALFEGGVFEVRGLHVVVDGEPALLVGDRREPGYIKPLAP